MKWRCVSSGIYKAIGSSGVVYEVERLDKADDPKPGWLLRVNGIVTDRELTFRELKRLAAQYEA